MINFQNWVKYVLSETSANSETYETKFGFKKKTRLRD